MDAGIVYVATGETYREECLASVQSVNQAMPEIPVTVFTDAPLESECIERCEIISDPEYGSPDVIRSLPDSPYDKTIYFDTDIYLDDDISEIYEMLSEFDLGVAIDPLHIDHREGPLPHVPPNFPEFNCGVIAYRTTDRMERFCETWLRLYEYQTDTSADQPSFRDTLYHSELRVVPLPPEYNCLYGVYPGYVRGPVKVFHGRLIDTDDVEGLEYDYDPAEIREKLNASSYSRVYTHKRGFSVDVYREDDTNPLRKFLDSLDEDGPVDTVRKVESQIENNSRALRQRLQSSVAEKYPDRSPRELYGRLVDSLGRD